MKKISLTIVAFLALATINAQQKDSLTTKDYANAEQFLFYSVAQKIDHAFTTANWIDDNKFWYRVLTPQGSEFILVDAAKATRTSAFDQQKLATALSSATGKN